MKTVFTAESPAQAHLVSGLLEEMGIRNVVEGEALFGIRGDIGLTPSSLPRVSVADEDLERAIGVLREQEARLLAERRAETADPDAESDPRPVRSGLRIALLWVTLLGAASLAGGPRGFAVALPIVGVCAYLHLIWHVHRNA